MQTFLVQVLGCRVNQYEAEQLAALLRRRGLVEAATAEQADLRIVHTCSVTAEAGRKSGQVARRMTRLPVLTPAAAIPRGRARTVVTGCWATSDPGRAAGIAGVDAVIPIGHDLSGRLDRLLDEWIQPLPSTTPRSVDAFARTLPVLDGRESANQRAYLKVQDGCDAYCTYCIIPRLRSRLHSKPVDACVDEARALADAGHREIVLTGIFLGAYGHATALRRRQQAGAGGLAELVEALCRRVDGLRRLRLSSLEPGDLTDALLAVLRAHRQVVPHFHLPLQSGSDAILRRMNRQYCRDDYLAMIDRVRGSFDRPAITTDVIVGFPGETDREFAHTLDVADRAGFIHTHAFAFSPRPGTAAARWGEQFVPPAAANERIGLLRERALKHSLEFRRQFIGAEVEVLVERLPAGAAAQADRHGRCERYFDVRFAAPHARAGEAVRVRIERVTADETRGTLIPGETAWAR